MASNSMEINMIRANQKVFVQRIIGKKTSKFTLYDKQLWFWCL